MRAAVKDCDAKVGSLGRGVKYLEVDLVLILVVAYSKNGEIPGSRGSEVWVVQPVEVGFVRESVELSLSVNFDEEIDGFWLVLVDVTTLPQRNPRNVRDVFIGAGRNDWLRSPLPAACEARQHLTIGRVLHL
jgi:hypothetical protein